jgi:hypothetical protein
MKPEGRRKCRPAADRGDCGVSVRGRALGYIDAPPWECDVTQWIGPGENDIEVTVLGTLQNTLPKTA